MLKVILPPSIAVPEVGVPRSAIAMASPHCHDAVVRVLALSPDAPPCGDGWYWVTRTVGAFGQLQPFHSVSIHVSRWHAMIGLDERQRRYVGGERILQLFDVDTK